MGTISARTIKLNSRNSHSITAAKLYGIRERMKAFDTYIGKHQTPTGQKPSKEYSRLESQISDLANATDTLSQIPEKLMQIKDNIDPSKDKENSSKESVALIENMSNLINVYLSSLKKRTIEGKLDTDFKSPLNKNEEAQLNIFRNDWNTKILDLQKILPTVIPKDAIDATASDIENALKPRVRMEETGTKKPFPQNEAKYFGSHYVENGIAYLCDKDGKSEYTVQKNPQKDGEYSVIKARSGQIIGRLSGDKEKIRRNDIDKKGNKKKDINITNSARDAIMHMINQLSI